MALRPRRHRTDKFGRRLVASGVEGASQHLQRFRFIGDALKTKTSRLDFLECGSCPNGEAESALALDRPFKARAIGLHPRSGFPGRAHSRLDQFDLALGRPDAVRRSIPERVSNLDPTL